MPIYIAGRKVEAWKEINQTSGISNGANSDEIDLVSTNGTYGNYFINWQYDNRTAYRWYDAGGGTGWGYGILRGNSGNGNYTYSNMDGASTFLSSSVPIANTGVGSAYTLGTIAVPINVGM